MTFCTVHTHSTFCDGRDSLADMARAAYEAGAVSFGASGHSPTKIPEDRGGISDLDGYRAGVLRLREAYAGRMDVLLGIELDGASSLSPEEFDYWIGSVHFLRGPDGRYWPVDYGAERLAACRDQVFGADALALAEAYYQAVAAMAARKPTILGHLDLVTKFNAGNRFLDSAAPRYRRAALDALRAADPAATLLEINTGAMARGFRDTPYPAPFLLEAWRAMGGRVILTADAHRADAVAYAYAQAAEAARAAGYASHILLTRGGWREAPL